MKLDLMKILLAIVASLGIQNVAHSQDTDKMFTVYLARHAEKQADAANLEDPSLSACGEQRSIALATILKSVGLERVYSTDFQRSLATARPVAESHQLEIETYDPEQMEAFSVELLKRRQNALVIGHSNTTAVLAGLLAGQEGESFSEFSEDEYDRLYLVTVAGGQGQVNMLDQAFRCE